MGNSIEDRNRCLARRGLKTSEWAIEYYFQFLEWPEPDVDWLSSLSRWFQKNGESLTEDVFGEDIRFDYMAFRKLEDQINSVQKYNERVSLVGAINSYHPYGWYFLDERRD